MDRRKRDNILMLILILVMAFVLFALMHFRAEAVLGESARRMLIVDTVSQLEGLPTMCDFGGCPVEKPKSTEPEIELIFEETSVSEPETEPEQYEEVYEEYEPEEEAVYISGDYLGTFKCTAYCGCYNCSEGYGNMTATGAYARANHTIAVDPSVLPYGTKVTVNGTVYTAEDCGGGVNGNHIDIYFDSHSECERFGTQWLDVYLAN